MEEGGERREREDNGRKRGAAMISLHRGPKEEKGGRRKRGEGPAGKAVGRRGREEKGREKEWEGRKKTPRMGMRGVKCP